MNEFTFVQVGEDVATVLPYDPASPYSVLDVPGSGYDQLVLLLGQQMAVMPPRGY